MPISLAILLTLLASSLMNVGIVVLKKWIAAVPSAQLFSPPRLLANISRSRLACLGFTLQLSGYALFCVAASAHAAPISVLQPLCAFGLVVLALLAVFYLQEKLTLLEWSAIGLLLAGVVLLGVSLETAPVHPPTLRLSRYALFLAGLGLYALLLMAFAAQELPLGLLASALLGSGYLSTKAFFLAWQEGSLETLALCFIGIAIGQLGGFVALLLAMRHSRAFIIKAVSFVSNQVIVIVGGWFCFDEHFPDEPLSKSARLAGFAAILLGIMGLALLRHEPRKLVADPERLHS